MQFRRALLDSNGIEHWESDEPLILHADDRLALTLRTGQLLVPYQHFSLSSAAEPMDIWQAQSDGDLLELLMTNVPQHVTGFSTNNSNSTNDPVPYLDRFENVANWNIIGNELLQPGQRLLWIDDTIKYPNCVLAWFELHDYCQVINRTETLRIGEYGVPRLFNNFSIDPSERAEQVISAAKKLPMPRVWAPPNGFGDDPSQFGTDPPPSSYWLKQLKKPERKR